MKFKTSSGFTLIELLVVVAIIGILASIVLASLGTARSKGRDASAKGSLSSMRAEAEIMFDDMLSYDTVCDTTSDAYTLFESAVRQVGGPSAIPVTLGAAYNCQDDAGSWAAHVQLIGATPAGVHFCTDSNGFAGTGTAAQDYTVSGSSPWNCTGP